MTKQDEFVAAITAAVMEAIDAKMENISCPLNYNEKQSMKQLYGIFKDAGDGDMDKGIRKFRGILEFTGSIYNWRNIISGAVLLAGIMAVFGWLASIFISGLASAIRSL